MDKLKESHGFSQEILFEQFLLILQFYYIHYNLVVDTNHTHPCIGEDLCEELFLVENRNSALNFCFLADVMRHFWSF